MNYLSLVFVAFVAVVFGLYNLFPQKHRWKVLLCASLFFYLCYDVKYIFFLFGCYHRLLESETKDEYRRSSFESSYRIAMDLLFCASFRCAAFWGIWQWV